jgi:hypothetical protein
MSKDTVIIVRQGTIYKKNTSNAVKSGKARMRILKQIVCCCGAGKGIHGNPMKRGGKNGVGEVRFDTGRDDKTISGTSCINSLCSWSFCFCFCFWSPVPHWRLPTYFWQIQAVLLTMVQNQSTNPFRRHRC